MIIAECIICGLRPRKNLHPDKLPEGLKSLISRSVVHAKELMQKIVSRISRINNHIVWLRLYRPYVFIQTISPISLMGVNICAFLFRHKYP
jgi:hypothetical protein